MSNIKDFVIENGVLKKYNGSDTDVVIPDSVTSIGESAFSWWDNLKSVTIPDSVTYIGNRAFAYCRGLESVIIPDSVTSIGRSAFYECENLQSITIPDSVTSIGAGAFYGCKLLKDEKEFVIVRNELFAYFGGEENVVIPDSVTSIGDSAFYLCLNIQSITIPDSVTNIGAEAFSRCRNLQNITIPDSVTSIGNSAFWWCENLQSITIPDSVTSIGDSAFYECENLQSITIPDSVTNIGDSAFYECENLQSITIPDSVTSIGDKAFYWCSNIQSITIPDFVTSIGNGAFSGCKNLKSVKIPDSVTSIGESVFYGCQGIESITIPDFVTSIGNGAFRGCKNLKSVTIPDSVTSIGSSAFSGCKNLQSITIPDSVTRIGDYAFSGCENLQSITIPDSIVIEKEFFGWRIPDGMVNQLDNLFVKFTESAIKQYLINDSVWEKLSAATQGKILFMIQSNPLKAVCDKYINKENADDIANVVIGELSKEASAKECKAVAFCMDVLVNKASDEIIKQMYDWLFSQKKGKNAVAALSENIKFTGILGIKNKVKKNLREAEKLVIERLLASNKSKDDLANTFKGCYSITEKDIPRVTYKDGGVVSEIVLMWLFTTHERLVKYPWGETDVVASYKKAGICDEAKEILSYIDEVRFQRCLKRLADKCLGISGNSKKRFLAYPICRYADEKLITELTNCAPKWRSSVSGNDAPPLRAFRNAVIYSEFRSAMMFADKYDGLEYYAEVRDTTEDTIRDKYLSDVGVDSDGCKGYDLGNQKVVAKLQSDLSFIVVLENGKTAKSLPKKGADEKLYEEAKADFDAMKKDAKKIVKNRKDKLFEDFLSGRERKADEWQKSYIDNPLLRMVASLFVWVQGNKTFTLKDGTPVTADGLQYCIGKGEIKVAHPMEMKHEDVTAWQQYFVSNGIKQPFEQIWEPVIDSDQVKSDRYKGAKIPYYRFTGKTKHGIDVEDYDFHNDISISLKDCDAIVNRLDWQRHRIDVTDCFEIESFRFKEYNRQVNHLVAYFDRCTVYDRIVKDDVAVEVLLKQFTLAQITEFIRVASENNAANVQALLLEYKNKNFSDFDPMEEFTLD